MESDRAYYLDYLIVLMVTWLIYFKNHSTNDTKNKECLK